MHRRQFLRGAGGLSLAAISSGSALAVAAGDSPIATDLSTSPVPVIPNPSALGPSRTESILSLPLIRAQPDRIISITVCTRPFRPQGARVETERLGRKTVVHNYGHGGSGWSLSWGSSTYAVRYALATGVREIAVIGCGALGLTSALLAQRAGLKVRIYAKERPPDVRSTFATGSWTPSSRYCSEEHATPELAQRWEDMARISHRTYQHLLGLPGDPIEWRDGYQLSYQPFDPNYRRIREGEPLYPELDKRIRDLTPHREELLPGTHPFPVPYVRRYTNMIFNISAYTRMLIGDFLAAGGAIETREFMSPSDLAKLKEKTLINATGYGARALFGDESIVPVRGQLMRLIPQPEVTYGLSYNEELSVVPRRDGIVVQTQAKGDFGSTDITPDRAAAEQAVLLLAQLNEGIKDK